MNETEVVITDRDFWLVGIAFLALALAVATLIVNVVILSGESQFAAETHSALCTYRGQLVDQVKSSEQYLAKHPEGAPALHLSAASIQQSIDKEQAAVNSLDGLNCNH